MKFTTGTQPDKDYYKGYESTLSQSVREKCKEFSLAYFRDCNKGFGKKVADIALVKEKIQAIQNVFQDSGDKHKNFIDYLEFLILNKGNYEFMIPYYKICTDVGHTPLHNIEIHHHTHHFGLMGTVDEILA
jgi:hypothetical protein